MITAVHFRCMAVLYFGQKNNPGIFGDPFLKLLLKCPKILTKSLWRNIILEVILCHFYVLCRLLQRAFFVNQKALKIKKKPI